MKKKMLVGSVVIILVLLSFGLYHWYTSQQNTITDLFNDMDISKLSSDDIEKKMKQSSDNHGYQFKKEGNNTLILAEESKHGASLSYQKTNDVIAILNFDAGFNKVKNSKITDDQIKKIKIGMTYQEVCEILGSPTRASKNQTNNLVYATWSKGVGDSIEYRFDDDEKVKSI
ncbi:hypothetical protein BCR24_06240 [Enterococcus ureilyticus]|uniref:Outer membrane protein assembly factor BamE domain-containing protein n=1 Tax=Enterococcus ureilyticus TaxID=1131292 RepID=A0A1E5HAA3_9ENTE|nr:outer membrane protein assembly factor BamE [Enterococcus ureilyticus]MBM7688174.1 hypothetical protein [Enterococcus ureilyticus]OEG21881.1 hypothetical protein BCR24_06240 [Enterococcus ureilyticus]